MSCMFGVVKMERVRLFVVVASILVMCVVRRVGGEEVADTLSACDFPAIYNFGDSNSDTGGISAAFYPMASPCGETFFHRPAGRGCDGRLMIDFIAKHLGLPYLSPYLDSLESNFRHGANFATGGATIIRYNESWFQNGVSPFSLDIQIAQYQQLKSRTTSLYNRAKKQPHRFPRVDDFSKALYIFDIGQNDVAAGIRKMSDEQFQAQIPDIINQLATAIRNLYDQGARTFWIHNTGPIGCLAVTLHYLHNPSPDYVDRRGCVKFQNDMARQFNRALKQKVFQLRKELLLAAITHVNVFAAKYKLLSNAKKHGFLDKTRICCGYHEGSNHVYCGNKGIINGTQVYAGSCEDPSLYISWDGVHYTEAANHWIADQLISGSFSDPPLPITNSCHRLQPL
ncbi:hypothetical protein L3X38_020537 [Prunus dulcis]|uniref:GDSL-like Lipase/Acylhydrolase superfamily protein n=1 Tax=Prunus dulcis TaxID=3755 RepID=A0AAD4WDZ5_PRUDU|nr:hypothetical protein L3X38_020537 [Prunus dulcis]